MWQNRTKFRTVAMIIGCKLTRCNMKSIEIKNVNLKFETELSNFSSNNVALGTLAMLTVTCFLKNSKILSLGCGYGVAGILAGKLIGRENIIMYDVSKGAT